VQGWQTPHIAQLSQRAAVKFVWLVLNFGKNGLKICLDVKHNRLGINTSLFLGAFAKLRKATFSFVMSVRLSFDLEQLASNCMDFHEIYLIGGKQWQTTPKNFPRMQRTRAIPVA
jgi:hypothetical protein